jgi:hypothetical protein
MPAVAVVAHMSQVGAVDPAAAELVQATEGLELRALPTLAAAVVVVGSTPVVSAVPAALEL